MAGLANAQWLPRLAFKCIRHLTVLRGNWNPAVTTPLRMPGALPAPGLRERTALRRLKDALIGPRVRWASGPPCTESGNGTAVSVGRNGRQDTAGTGSRKGALPVVPDAAAEYGFRVHSPGSDTGGHLIMPPAIPVPIEQYRPRRTCRASSLGTVVPRARCRTLCQVQRNSSRAVIDYMAAENRVLPPWHRQQTWT
jgi:hypothetical protein